MRGGTRKGAETERGKPRRGEHQERNGHRDLGNTDPRGTDLVSASIPEAGTRRSSERSVKWQEGQRASRGARGYREGKDSEDGSLGGIDMKQGRADEGGIRRREAEKA